MIKINKLEHPEKYEYLLNLILPHLEASKATLSGVKMTAMLDGTNYSVVRTVGGAYLPDIEVQGDGQEVDNNFSVVSVLRRLFISGYKNPTILVRATESKEVTCDWFYCQEAGRFILGGLEGRHAGFGEVNMEGTNRGYIKYIEDSLWEYPEDKIYFTVYVGSKMLVGCEDE